jgi:peptidoglycan/xylan/chitin deacetylase (PgdA/CDA1 family)
LKLPVLVMHHVKWDRPGDNPTELGLTIHPVQFRQEVRYLAIHRFHTVSAARVVSVLTGSGSLPSRPVVLTFDDGYADMFTNVYPVLRARHMTATFFVCPGLIGKRRYLTWKQVAVMARHGMDIEAHTMTHPDLTTVPAAQQWREIRGSREVLRSRLHVGASVFAYPYGAYNASVLENVRRAGYRGAFTTRQGWHLLRGTRYQLPRVYVDRDDSLAQFAARLNGNLAIVSQDST